MRYVIIVSTGTEIFSEEFNSEDAVEQARRFFESVEGAKIEVIEDDAPRGRK
jgi:hypothetical protein